MTKKAFRVGSDPPCFDLKFGEQLRVRRYKKFKKFIHVLYEYDSDADPDSDPERDPDIDSDTDPDPDIDGDSDSHTLPLYSTEKQNN